MNPLLISYEVYLDFKDSIIPAVTEDFIKAIEPGGKYQTTFEGEVYNIQVKDGKLILIK